MKNTALDTTSSRDTSRALAVRADRYKAVPFLLLMFSSGLPINYSLEPAHAITVAEATELTLQAQSSANIGNAIGFSLFVGALYLASAWMLMKRPQKVIAILREQWPVVLFVLFIAASVSWSYYPEKVVINILHNIGTVMIALAATLYYRHDPWKFPKQLGYVLGLNMVLQVGAAFLIPEYAIDWQNRWHGLTTHPNTLGAMAFVTLWANAAILICKKDSKVFLHLVFSALAITAIIGADSVTSMMVSVCVVFLVYMFNKLGKMRAGFKFYFSVVGVATVVGLLLVLLGGAFDLGWLFGMFNRDTNLTGRASVWEDAMSAIIEHPMVGWSFDDHSYLIQNKNMPYPSYHNGYLDLAVSGGLVSMVLLFMLFATWAKQFTKPYLIARQIAPFSAAYTVAYLIHNMTEASMVSPRGQMWQIFLVLLFLGACRKWTPRTPLYESAQNAQQAMPSAAPIQPGQQPATLM